MQEGITMPSWLEQCLVEDGKFDSKQIWALRLAMANSGVNAHAKSYAHGMAGAFNQFGIEGVIRNIEYLLINLRGW